MGGWKVWLSQSGTEAIKRYATEEEVEEEAERDEAALKTRISADDGGDASNVLRLPSAFMATTKAILLTWNSTTVITHTLAKVHCPCII